MNKNYLVENHRSILFSMIYFLDKALHPFLVLQFIQKGSWLNFGVNFVVEIEEGLDLAICSQEHCGEQSSHVLIYFIN